MRLSTYTQIKYFERQNLTKRKAFRIWFIRLSVILQKCFWSKYCFNLTFLCSLWGSHQEQKKNWKQYRFIAFALLFSLFSLNKTHKKLLKVRKIRGTAHFCSWKCLVLFDLNHFELFSIIFPDPGLTIRFQQQSCLLGH